MSNPHHCNSARSTLESQTRGYLRDLRTYHRAVRMRRGVRQALEALEAHGMHSVSPVIRERVASILDGLKPVPLEPGERRVVSLDEWRTRKAVDKAVDPHDASVQQRGGK